VVESRWGAPGWGVAEWLRAGGGECRRGRVALAGGGGGGAPEIGQIVAGRSCLAMCACASEGGIGGRQTALIQFGR
jgi:hypothetical protein